MSSPTRSAWWMTDIRIATRGSDLALAQARSVARRLTAAHPGPTISDRGIGIAPEHVKRIFEKFVRVETGLVHDVKGAGLGLSLVDLIMRAHGGRVEVSSTPGEGSTFTLVVPVAEGAHETRPEPQRKTGS